MYPSVSPPRLVPRLTEPIALLAVLTAIAYSLLGPAAIALVAIGVAIPIVQRRLERPAAVAASCLLGVTLGLGLVVAAPSTAWAQDAPPVNITEAGTVGTIEVDVVILSLIAGTIIPIATRLVSGVGLSSKGLALVNLVLTLVGAGVAHLLANSGATSWPQLVAAVGAAYLASGSTYSHLWKPTGVIDATARAVPGGLGGRSSA